MTRISGRPKRPLDASSAAWEDARVLLSYCRMSRRRPFRCRTVRWLAFAGWLLLVLTPTMPAALAMPAATNTTVAMQGMADCHGAMPAAPDTGTPQAHAACHCAAMSGSILSVAAARTSAIPPAPDTHAVASSVPALPAPWSAPPLRPPQA